jgi:2,5-dioxopentanoate dehydrogenase
MIHGKNILGFELSAKGGTTFHTYSSPAGEVLPGSFVQADSEEVEHAVAKAKAAYAVYKNKPGLEKASFLRAIADEIEALGAELIERACAESGLPEARITGERGRTTGQLRLFATLLEDGHWAEATIDTALPDRAPVPRPDIRKMLLPVGPVVVFTASNFPLAFSTAGGDTASALAAGNPVIVKVHPYHAGTNELVAGAIAAAAKKTGMPDGVFSSLNAIEFSVGETLVLHPEVKSVAFTGSFFGGKSLHELAQKRKEPIPVFAEMGSVNPVILLPEKLESAPAQLAATMASSLNMGAGQFCTNPGVMVVMESEAASSFQGSLAQEIKKLAPQAMLHHNIYKNYTARTEEIFTKTQVEKLAESDTEGSSLKGRPAVARVSGSDFIQHPEIAEEIFGPFSLLIVCSGADELEKVMAAFDGQLTASVLATDADVEKYATAIKTIQEVVGRLIFNGVPTGVEVCYAMQHGGPYPSTTDGRFTSVGVDAIKRFVRPVAFQDAPDAYLPDELRDANPLKIWRRINGQLSQEPIKR